MGRFDCIIIWSRRTQDCMFEVPFLSLLLIGDMGGVFVVGE